MGKLRVDEITALLPKLDELRPLLDLVIAASVPDPEREWTGSGELGTVGQRLVRAAAVEAGVPELAERVREHLAAIYGNVGRAIRALERGDEAEACAALLGAADREEEWRRLERAEAYSLAAYRLARGLKDRRPAALALRRAARVALEIGNFEAARWRYEEAFEIGRDAGDDVAAAAAAIGAGNVALYRGLWERARAWYGRALERIGADGPPRAEHWQIYQNLSVTDRRLGDLEASRTWIEKAEAVASTLRDPEAVTDIRHGHARLFMASGDPARAEEAYRAALAAATRPVAVVATLVNLGECLLVQGRTLEAAECARKAEQTAIVSGVVFKLPEVYRLLGAVAEARGLQDAFVFYERALDLVSERGLSEFERAQTLEAYAKWGLQAGDRESAVARLAEAETIYRRAGMEQELRGVLDTLAGVEE
ncbi:MAG: tetratricopeptide repeat protein [Gemmatimonadetes bacterium]|nr:tetratricopeptide repeat protein [Gemmatimonadota bacterium]